MNRENAILSKEERDVLILGGIHLNGKQLSNTEIGQYLGIPVNKVKTIIHQSCIKLKAHGRNEAITFALIRGEINIAELYSIDEIAERFTSLDPDMLRRISQLVRQGMNNSHFILANEPAIRMERRQGTLLTKAERDVLILAGYGLPNKEIADKLCISISAVRTFIYRACTKLGASRRADAVILAVKQREISAYDIFTPDQLIQVLIPLGAESLEKMAELLDQKIGRKAVLG
jgi:DNA-binding CsgD family transcriptional regulator